MSTLALLYMKSVNVLIKPNQRDANYDHSFCCKRDAIEYVTGCEDDKCNNVLGEVH